MTLDGINIYLTNNIRWQDQKEIFHCIQKEENLKKYSLYIIENICYDLKSYLEKKNLLFEKKNTKIGIDCFESTGRFRNKLRFFLKYNNSIISESILNYTDDKFLLTNVEQIFYIYNILKKYLENFVIFEKFKYNSICKKCFYFVEEKQNICNRCIRIENDFEKEVESFDINTGYIYFLKFEEKIKIGFSTSFPHVRIENYLAGIPGDNYEIIYTEEGNLKKEKYLHRYFVKSHITREWFFYTKEIKKYINENRKFTVDDLKSRRQYFLKS